MKDTRLFFDLLFAMTEKELRARYKHTVFGFLWVFINPLIQMLIIGFIFPFFIKEPIEHYSLYLFTGLLTWNFFSLSLTKTTPSIVFERSLIKKARFPHAVIPLSIILSNTVNLLLAFLLVIPASLYFHIFSLVSLVYFFAGLVMLLGFTTGISLLAAALNVRFRDVNFFVQTILIVWFYLTPVVYSIYFVPRSVLWIWRLNPMTSAVQFFQKAFVDFPAPGVAMISINAAITILVLVLSIWIFQRESKYFDDWL